MSEPADWQASRMAGNGMHCEVQLMGVQFHCSNTRGVKQ
jgi:hypothetical protein